MLARNDGLDRDQLLSDLLAARARVAAKWNKGGFVSSEGAVCVMAAVNQTVGLSPRDFNYVAAASQTPEELRMGRVVVALHDALYGPEASNGRTLTQAQQRVAKFNDSDIVTHEAVLLLFDRAIAEVLAPPVVSA